MATKVLVPWDRANSFTVPDGRYILQIKEAKAVDTNSGATAVQITYLVKAPKEQQGRTFPIRYNLDQGAAIEELRQLCVAIFGPDRIPRKASALDLDLLVGKLIKATAYTTKGKQGGEFQHLKEVELYKKQAPEPEPEPEPEDDLGGEVEDDEDLEIA